MADNKKYYYMRLKENFFDSDEMIILENMDNGDGIIYSNILLKLYLRSLKYEGRLMFNERIPFNPQMLSTIVRHPVGVVEKALKAFIDLGLVEIMDNGAIYMLDIQNFIGKTTTEADRKKKYRARIAQEKGNVLGSGQMSRQTSDKRTPETEKELEKELKIDIDIENREKEPTSLLAEFLNLFINFSSKNLSKKAITQVEFLKLPSFQQEQAVIGAKNYIEWYKNEKPEDTKGQYSVNSANFLSNMMFVDYQKAPKTVQGTLGGMI
ncbi:phage replisome organizer protein [Lactococcus petauri]|uniref:phage replisome organizer protein n=1 Tax=Lactococcus petauri TaxID=1940789 RepID=UPI0022E313C9|nr:phage replisome organiser protein [Lactococcus petauri]